MKNFVIEWTLDLTRQLGTPLTIDEIEGVEISVSGDNGLNWSAMPLIPPTILTTTISDMDVGSYLVRGVVVDKLGQRSTPVVQPAEVPDESPPSALESLTVTLS